MIEARYASLLAFAQSRGADCGRDADGKFSSGNNCAVTAGDPGKAVSSIGPAVVVGAIGAAVGGGAGAIGAVVGGIAGGVFGVVHTYLGKSLSEKVADAQDEVGISGKKLDAVARAIGAKATEDSKAHAFVTTRDAIGLWAPNDDIVVITKNNPWADDGNKSRTLHFEPTPETMRAGGLAAKAVAAAKAAGAVYATASSRGPKSSADLEKAGFTEVETTSPLMKFAGTRLYQKKISSSGRDSRNDTLTADRRAADCGRDEGGAFAVGNTCGADGGRAKNDDARQASAHPDGPIDDGVTIAATESYADATVERFDWSAAEAVAAESPALGNAIRAYASGHHDANGYFRHGGSEDSLQAFAESIGSTPEAMRARASDTDAAVSAIAAASNPSGRTLTSFRGLTRAGATRRAYVAAIKTLAVGDILKEDGLFSTSASLRATAASFTSKEDGVIFRVRGRSGAPIARLANWNNEHEVLYPHRTSFVVTAIARDVTVSLGGGNDWRGVTVIDIEERR
jgi:hypothetical protein